MEGGNLWPSSSFLGPSAAAAAAADVPINLYFVAAKEEEEKVGEDALSLLLLRSVFR